MVRILLSLITSSLNLFAARFQNECWKLDSHLKMNCNHFKDAVKAAYVHIFCILVWESVILCLMMELLDYCLNLNELICHMHHVIHIRTYYEEKRSHDLQSNAFPLHLKWQLCCGPFF